MKWSKRIEEHALRMRMHHTQPKGATASLSKAVALIPPPSILKVKPAPVVKLTKKERAAREAWDSGAYQREQRARRERRALAAAGDPEVQAPPTVRQHYPMCLFCKSETIRAGKVRGEQRYRCMACRRTFYGDACPQPSAVPFVMTCNRCGSGNCEFRGLSYRMGSGAAGYCRECCKRFTQGGRHHLDHTLVVLLGRIRALPGHDDIKADVYAEAAIGILGGLGYTWNIPLNATDARARLYKAYGDEGSDHPALSGRPRGDRS